MLWQYWHNICNICNLGILYVWSQRRIKLSLNINTFVAWETEFLWKHLSMIKYSHDSLHPHTQHNNCLVYWPLLIVFYTTIKYFFSVMRENKGVWESPWKLLNKHGGWFFSALGFYEVSNSTMPTKLKEHDKRKELLKFWLMMFSLSSSCHYLVRASGVDEEDVGEGQDGAEV